MILNSIVGLCALTGPAARTEAQSYPIDCAILLCLAGGWPASVPCTQARAEFMRRITPWPVEPPLQIWRCPMGASFRPRTSGRFDIPVHDVLFDGAHPRPEALRKAPLKVAGTPVSAGFLSAPVEPREPAVARALALAQHGADIDISGPEFNFVRSIRVYHVRQARQRRSSDGSCNRYALVTRGTYGRQGEFSWQPSIPRALPDAHSGLERWGDDCPNINHRSVFVDWRDFEGLYDFEQVNY
nr:hypothetical protein [Marinibacterium profundimaris]